MIRRRLVRCLGFWVTLRNSTAISAGRAARWRWREITDYREAWGLRVRIMYYHWRFLEYDWPTAAGNRYPAGMHDWHCLRNHLNCLDRRSLALKRPPRCGWLCWWCRRVILFALFATLDSWMR